jgi:nicotinamide mononucleotide (NMN) deamidase PncC
MALGCRRTFDVDFALAVSAPSRADDRESEPTAPLAWIALADEQGVDVRELNIAGDPAIVKSRLAKSVLNLLRLKLIRGS